MSRSKLRDKYMRRRYKGSSYKEEKWFDFVRNPHRQDEMPKNRPSKLIQSHCPIVKVSWLQSTSTFRGHSCSKDGHRIVRGLVRASLQREYKKWILEQLAEYYNP